MKPLPGREAIRLNIFIGKNHFHLFPNKKNEAIYTQVVQDAASHSEYGDPFVYPEFPEKEMTYWNWSLQSVKGANDEVDGLVLSMSDVTGLKNAEKKLEDQYQEMLKLSIAEHKQRQLAETLSEVSLALNQTLDLETVMDTLLEYVHRLVPYDCATIFLSEDEARLGVRANRCYNENLCCNPSLHAVFDIWDYPFIQVVFANQESFLIEDVSDYPDWTTGLYGEYMQNWLGLPMIVSGNVIGIIGLAKSRPGFFNSKHIQLAELIAAQVSVAIQNAWLFEQVRAGHERLQSLSHRLVEVQESERRYISRELHDGTSQALTSIVFGLRLLEQAEDRSENIKPRIAELKEITARVLENLHRLAVNLRPVSLDHLGLIPALEQLIKDMGGHYNKNIRFKQLGFNQGERLPEELATPLYRIAQEALTNAVRHANASMINLILEQRDDHVVVIVEDNGVGFDADVIQKSGHLGLLGMQERAQMILGNLQIESQPGQGTTIVVEIPYAYPNLDRR